MPFVSVLLDSKIVMEEYANTKFEASLDLLFKPKEEGGYGYKHIRKMRKDGNCFYRAFIFQLFEHYAMRLKQGIFKFEYDKLVKIVDESKKDLIDNAGYNSIVIEDFYDVFLRHLKKLEKLPADFAEHCGKMDESEEQDKYK